MAEIHQKKNCSAIKAREFLACNEKKKQFHFAVHEKSFAQLLRFPSCVHVRERKQHLSRRFSPKIASNPTPFIHSNQLIAFCPTFYRRKNFFTILVNLCLAAMFVDEIRFFGWRGDLIEY